MFTTRADRTRATMGVDARTEMKYNGVFQTQYFDLLRGVAGLGVKDRGAAAGNLTEARMARCLAESLREMLSDQQVIEMLKVGVLKKLQRAEEADQDFGKTSPVNKIRHPRKKMRDKE